jgi:uncharacterized protein YndB with AHSA1/START domain
VPDVLFRFDVDAPPDTLLRALTTGEGIRSFWTSRAEVPAKVGETLKLEFPERAPLPFDLRLEQSDQRTVVWRTQTFPPHWVGTTVRWDVEARDDGCTVAFRHAGFMDDGEAGRAAYTWGEIMARLAQHAETGRSDPALG